MELPPVLLSAKRRLLAVGVVGMLAQPGALGYVSVGLPQRACWSCLLIFCSGEVGDQLTADEWHFANVNRLKPRSL